MKPYLVDVPVSLNVFVRPETLGQVFSVVKKARPSILFLVGDGARKEVPSDAENIRKSRKIVEEIDWDCKVYKLYTSDNRGMYTTGLSTKKYIFNYVDRCIFLEDDVLVSVSFFKYCAELLEKYKDDLRINYISGMNYLGEYKEPTSDYFFSKESSIWGYATWKRTMNNYNHLYRNDKYIVSRTKSVAKADKNGFVKKIDGYVKDDIYEGHIAGGEYFKKFLSNANSQFAIIPTKNMVCNLGFSAGATHSPGSLNKIPKGIQRVFNMKIYEYDFPLTHPTYFVRDLFYEKKVNRIFAFSKPLVKFYRRIESVIRYLYYGDIDGIKNKIKKITFKKNIKNEN